MAGEPIDPKERVDATREEQKAREELGKNTAERERLKEQIELQKEYAEVLRDSIDLKTELGIAGRDYAAAEQKINEDILSFNQNLIYLQNQLNDAREKGRDTSLFEQDIQAQEQQIENANNYLAAIEATKKAESEMPKVTATLAKAAKDLGVELDKLPEQIEEIEENLGGLDLFFQDAFGNAPGLIGDVYRQATKVKGALGDAGARLAKQGGILGKLGNQLVKFGSVSIGEMFPYVAVGLFIKKIFDLSLQVNNLSKEIGAATGFGDQFNYEFIKMTEQGNMAGIGFRESANALKSLTEGLSSFTPAAEATNMQVGMTVARLEKLGVGAGSSVKSIDLMQRAMGMTAEQAANATAQIARMGKEIGITGTKMINDFNSASSRLAIYGDNNIEVFKGLAAAAKATGIEMQSLINISKQFDTFDKAADQAAKLNAVLGTQLSTLELMSASDEERILMIKQQVQASVGNFDSLDKFTKMYIQQAMGVASVDEAQRLLNMSTAEYQRYQQGQQEQADIQAEIANASERLVPLMQQLKLLGTQFLLAFSPIIQLFIPLIKGITWLLGWVAKGIEILAPWVALLSGVAFFIAKITGGAAMLVSALNPITAGVLAVVGAFTLLFKLFGARINPLFVQIFHFLAEGISFMLSPLTAVVSGVKAFGGVLGRLFGIAKDDAANMVNNDSFNLEAIANIDMDRVSAGISKVKSALVDLSSVKVSGLLAMTTDGTNTSLIMGSVATEMAMLLNGGKLEVDVRIPEITIPPITVNVYVGNELLKTYIDDRINEKVGAFT